MRLDHIALRVKNRVKTAKFLQEAFGYKVQTEFQIFFDERKTQFAECIALEPPEKLESDLPWQVVAQATYHLAPEIFVSDGSPDSIVGRWVAARGGIGGVHHFAYQVDSVEDTMNLWKEKGWAEFSTEKPFTCDGLTQVFSVPHELTGVIYEFIERGKQGFCKENVKDLMTNSVDKYFK